MKDMKDMKELWETYTKGGIKWEYEIVKFVISNPEHILWDDNLWNEFKLYIKDLYLYDFNITDTTDRLMVVESVKKRFHTIINDDYVY